MKNNEELQHDVENAIKWEPSTHAAEIIVTAKDGVITLSGTVDSYTKKINAKNATKKVKGVKALAEDIKVEFGHSLKENDTEIAKDILYELKYNSDIPSDKIQIKVENGLAQLTGEVAWKHQEEATESVIKNLFGIREVSNLIQVKSETKDTIEQNLIESSLSRDWYINSKDIKVSVKQDKVKLTGFAESLYQKEEAGRLSWNTPGVCSVENELELSH